MKRSQLGPGSKALERGSTFASRGEGLKRTELPRAGSEPPITGRGIPTAPSPARGRTLKRSQPKRDWSSARAKVETESACRLAHADDPCDGPLEAAHIVGREHDLKERHPHGLTDSCFVRPARICPLCRRHHRLYDAGERDLLGKLTVAEELQAVADSSVNGGPGLENARVRLAPPLYRSTKASAA